jgi:broad specificity phosphatase PhoE
MSMLTVVRHGQASFDSDDYDQLSDLGKQQARLLGKHWADQQLSIDVVYAGPRVRQQQSAEQAGIDYKQAGFDWPQPIMLQDLDEYDLNGLFNCFAPKLAEREPEFARLQEVYRNSVGRKDRLRDFQTMFEFLLHQWQIAEPSDEFESWPAFRGRVERVIRLIQQQSEHGCRAIVFTSGGFIGGVVQHALNVSNRTALELNWRIRNSSLTEFIFTRDRFTLDSFNMIPHLNDPTMWTYR